MSVIHELLLECYDVTLYNLAKSNRTLEKTSADLEKIEKVFTKELMFSFFVNPIMSDVKKREVVAEIAMSFELQSHVVNFLNILVDMDRMEPNKDIVQEFEMVYNKITDSRVGEDDQGSCAVDSWTQPIPESQSIPESQPILDSALENPFAKLEVGNDEMHNLNLFGNPEDPFVEFKIGNDKMHNLNLHGNLEDPFVEVEVGNNEVHNLNKPGNPENSSLEVVV
nr:ATP synthase delta chain [Ipomoea trifida]